MIQSIDAETLIKRVPDHFPPMERPGGQILSYGVGYSPDLRAGEKRGGSLSFMKSPNKPPNFNSDWTEG
jgi:hypothetical protein